MWARSLGQEAPLEKKMATHSSILAWRIPWTEEPGGLQSGGSQRVGYDWVSCTHTSDGLGRGTKITFRENDWWARLDKKKKRKRRSVSWNNQSCTWTQPFTARSCGKTERTLSPEVTDSAMEIPTPVSGWGEGVSSAGGQLQSWPRQGLERSSTRSNMAHTVACGGQQWCNRQEGQ